LGDIISVEAQMNCYSSPSVRQWLANFRGGMMFYLGCHLVDLILQIQGKPKQIIPLNKATGIDDVTGEDYGMAILEYSNGVSFAKTCAREIGGYARRQLVVTGSKGTIELKPFEMFTEDGHYTCKTEYNDIEWDNMGIQSQTEIFDRYDGMISSFASMVRGEIRNPNSYEYEWELYKTLLECCGKRGI
jgi:predicted dehydrogenase